MQSRRHLGYTLSLISVLAVGVFLPRAVSSASLREVIVSEIAWMGTTTSSNDEWIELYNNTGSAIDLARAY